MRTGSFGRLCLGCLLLALFSGLLRSQDAPLRAFSDYVNSNSRFGAKLLKSLHAETPGENVVCSPIGISSLLAFLRDGTLDRETRREFNEVLEWSLTQKLGIFHRMFIGRFEAPRSGAEDETAGGEELWMKNSLLYRSSLVPGAFDRYRVPPKKDFGMEYVEVSGEKAWKAALADFSAIRELSDRERGNSIFLLKSAFHLGTRWSGNTFVRSRPGTAEFYPSPGHKVAAAAMVSEKQDYLHAKTAVFEAVVLPALNADFIVIMPEEGSTLRQLEESLARDPEMPAAALRKSYGDVELPQFDFSRNKDFKPLLEKLGLHNAVKSFAAQGIVYRLLGILQQTSILVDRNGVRADARAFTADATDERAIGDRPFHMKVNRPFIFQVRDNATGMLMLVGAVTDPSKH